MTWKEILLQLEVSCTLYYTNAHACRKAIKMAATADTTRLLDAEFVEGAAEDWECPICTQTLLDPFLLSCCGNHLCEACFKKVQDKSCPLCKEPTFTALLDKGRQRQVLQAKVCCPNSESGCEWQGELRHLMQHLEGKPSGKSPHLVPPTCLYEPVPCPNEGCGEKVPRLNVERHRNEDCLYRELTCRYCNAVTTTYKDLSETHWPVCPDFPVACPNNCGADDMRRAQVASHCERDCKMQVVPCPFWEVGCSIRRQRKDLTAHVKVSEQHHGQLLVKRTVEVKAKQEVLVAKLTEEIERVTADTQKQLQDRDDVIQRLDGEAKQHAAEFKEFVKNTNTRFAALEANFEEQLKERDDQIETLSLSLEKHAEEKGKSEEALAEMRERVAAYENKHTTTLKELAVKDSAREAEGKDEVSRMVEEVERELREEVMRLDEELAQVVTTTASLQAELGVEQENSHLCQVESDLETLRGEVTRHMEEMRDEVEKQVTSVKKELAPQREGGGADLAAMKADILAEFEKKNDDKLDEKLAELKKTQQAEHTDEVSARKAVIEGVLGEAKEEAKKLKDRFDKVGTEIKSIKSEVEYIEMAATPTPPFSFTVSRFSKRREKKESFVSDAFYSHLRGYRLVVRVDSAGTDTHVSVWCCITRGQHDAGLQWPLRADIFIRLLDQKNKKEFYERQISYDHQALPKHAGCVVTGDKNYLWGLREFITVKEVQSGHFLVGDALDFVVDRVEFREHAKK